MVKTILGIVAGLVSAGLLLLRWYSSTEQTKLRAFKDDEKERAEFEYVLRDAKRAKQYLNTARFLWREQLRKNRALRN